MALLFCEAAGSTSFVVAGRNLLVEETKRGFIPEKHSVIAAIACYFPHRVETTLNPMEDIDRRIIFLVRFSAKLTGFSSSYV